MLHTICNKKGISLIEALIAVFITTVAIVAIGAMQPIALTTAASSDYMGRAVAIAQAQATDLEAVIMTTGAALPADLPNVAFPVQNIIFRVTTTTQHPAANLWLVTVTVTCPGTANRVTYNRVVTQQMGY